MTMGSCVFALRTTLCWLLLFQHVVSFQITGATTGFIPGDRRRPARMEIVEFSKSGAPWDLYIQALNRFQQVPMDNILSYFQIAGIHGYPQQSWDNVSGQNSAAIGYCMHSSVNFATWHRPYLALFEQVLSVHAQMIAQNYPLEKQVEYSRAAGFLRMPYWDWVQHSRLPDVVTAETLLINTPNGTEYVNNPLLEYRFPTDMVTNDYFPSDNGQIAALNYTARHYNFTTAQSDQAAASAELTSNSASLLTNVYQLFSARTDWSSFSAYKLADKLNVSPNLESVHGDIHNHVGGLSNIAFGHMTDFTISAFDPVFWLHHANIDRLTAMWQAIYPDSWVQPVTNTGGSYYQAAYSMDTGDSVLAPFRRASNGTMWTANTIRDTATFGYTYPELIDWDATPDQLAATVREKVNELYNPASMPIANRTSRWRYRRSSAVSQIMNNVHANSALQLGVNNVETQYYLRIHIDETVASKVRAIFFFIGNVPDDAKTWSKAANLVTSYVPYFGDCGTTPEQGIDVTCTHTVAAAVDRGLLSTMDADDTVPFLKQHISTAIMDESGSALDGSAASGVRIAIVSRSVQPRMTMTEFPSYGQFRNHGLIIEGWCNI